MKTLSSTFHSFQLKAAKCSSNGLWILGLTRSASCWQIIYNVMSLMASSGVFNPFQRERFKSLSSGDVPHTLRATVIYQLPFGKGKLFLGIS